MLQALFASQHGDDGGQTGWSRRFVGPELKHSSPASPWIPAPADLFNASSAPVVRGPTDRPPAQEQGFEPGPPAAAALDALRKTALSLAGWLSLTAGHQVHQQRVVGGLLPSSELTRVAGLLGDPNRMVRDKAIAAVGALAALARPGHDRGAVGQISVLAQLQQMLHLIGSHINPKGTHIRNLDGRLAGLAALRGLWGAAEAGGWVMELLVGAGDSARTSGLEDCGLLDCLEATAPPDEVGHCCPGTEAGAGLRGLVKLLEPAERSEVRAAVAELLGSRSRLGGVVGAAVVVALLEQAAASEGAGSDAAAVEGVGPLQVLKQLQSRGLTLGDEVQALLPLRPRVWAGELWPWVDPATRDVHHVTWFWGASPPDPVVTVTVVGRWSEADGPLELPPSRVPLTKQSAAAAAAQKRSPPETAAAAGEEAAAEEVPAMPVQEVAEVGEEVVAAVAAVAVVVPKGSRAGERVFVEWAERLQSVVVPEGFFPGQSFDVPVFSARNPPRRNSPLLFVHPSV